MAYTNERLASLLAAFDHANKEWIYNRYCNYCGRFCYPEDRNLDKCKKCGTSIDRVILRPIPFITSATALEKLIIWVKDLAHSTRDDQYIIWMHQGIIQVTTEWVVSSMTPATYRQRVVDCVCRHLETHGHECLE